jgi:hypothetical protein
VRPTLGIPRLGKFFQLCVRSLLVPCGADPVFSMSCGKLGWNEPCRMDGREASRMIYFYLRARESRSCESRLERDGSGFELIVMEGRQSRVERFADARALATREHELRYEWLLSGWREMEEDADEYE